MPRSVASQYQYAADDSAAHARKPVGLRPCRRLWKVVQATARNGTFDPDGEHVRKGAIYVNEGSLRPMASCLVNGFFNQTDRLDSIRRGRSQCRRAVLWLCPVSAICHTASILIKEKTAFDERREHGYGKYRVFQG